MSDPDSDRDNRADGTAFLREMCAPDYELREWLDDVYDNHRRNLSANAEFYERAARVDGLFQRLLKACRLNLLGMEPSYFLFYRAHSAFLTAVALSLNGQLAEAHMVMRGCIEASLYALQVKRTPTLGQTWLERDHSADTRQAARREFTARRALDGLRQERPDIADHVQKLYEDTITYGAHPNIGAIFTSIAVVKEPDERARLAICYLNGPANPLFVVCLKRVLQVGLAAVDICAGIYPDEVSGLGLIEEIRDSAWQVTVCDPWPVATAPVIGA